MMAINAFDWSKMKKILIITAVLITAVSLFAQSGSAEITDIDKATDCEHIYTTVCVFDSNGRYMPDLSLSNFSFSENGTPVVPPDIVLLNSCEHASVDIALLLDFSGSMDDAIADFSLALSTFTDGLSDIDYRICAAIFNGCPEDPDGIRHMVVTDFSAAPPCTVGSDTWADNPADFSKLYQAAMLFYTLPWSARGSGWEDQYGALWWAVDTLDWRPSCRKVVVMFTDEEVQVETAPCNPYFDFSDSSLYQIMGYCEDESVTFFAVCPPDSQMQWYPLSGDSPDRAFYSGYRTLAESTGGIWSNIYDSSYTTMVGSLAAAIENIPCCYEFEYSTSKFCELADVNLEVGVYVGSDYIGSDDSFYLSFCEPHIEVLIPSPCGGITTCDDQWIKVLHDNANFGALSSYELNIADGGVAVGYATSIAGDTMFFFPDTIFSHRDTVVFEFPELLNSWGCIGSAPPCTFFVDLEPPTMTSHIPAEGETLFISDIDISAALADDFSGINGASVPGNIVITMGEDTLAMSPPIWSISGDSVIVSVDSIFAARSGSVTVCVSGLYDSPTYDYCPPNEMAPACWSFFVAAARRAVGFPIMFAAPCETVYIPLSIDGLELSIIGSATMSFLVDPDVLTPLSVVTSGALSDGWVVSDVEIDTATGSVSATISGTPLSGGAGGDFLFLKARVNCDAFGGDYTDLDIVDFDFNSGFPEVDWTDGFFYVTLTPEVFSCDLYLNKAISPNEFDRVVTFGASWGATDSYDSGIDIIDVPPPDWMVDGRFAFDDAGYPHIAGLLRDIRYPMPPASWHLATFDEPNGTIRWHPSDLPEGEFRMEHTIDMKRDSSATYGLDDTLLIEWYFPELAPAEMSIAIGWNMVSCPVLPTEMPADRVFDTDIGVFRYLPALRTYRRADLVQEGEGYWIWSDSAYSVMTAGGRLDRYSRSVFAGWNLIGAPASPISVSDIDISPSGGILGDIYSWDGTAYYPADSLRPGRAYWLLTSRDGVLEVPSGSRRRSKASPRAEWEAEIEVASENRSEQLYIAYSAASGERLSEGDVAIPPLPPSGEPTIASLLADGIALTRDLSGGTWRLSVDEPAAITFDIPEGVQLTLDGRPIRVGETNIDRGLYKIEYAPMLPERLSIIGCVPNPFNARTEIVVALPSAASLKIDIFDISGRSVRSISRKGSAGIVRVVWDGLSDSGAPLSSGLYLVRVRADDEAAFSRAMLIK